MIQHGSLFSGIGGFDLAAEIVGWNNIFHCEKDPFCQKVLQYYFPNSDSYDDIKQFDATKYYGTIDIISGGFPCQPFSVAGKQKGKDDDRYLWDEMLRVITECSPKIVVGENVSGIVRMALDEVLTSLESIGYTTTTFIIPACAVEAPHRRDRVWIIAYANGTSTKNKVQTRGNKFISKNIRAYKQKTTPNANGERLYCSEKIGQLERKRLRFNYSRDTANWKNFPSESPLCGGDDGLPKQLDGITFPKWRKESLKAYGNSVVVPLVVEIFNILHQVYFQE